MLGVCGCGCNGVGPCSSGLGQYPVTEGHSVPYTLSSSEVSLFIDTHKTDQTLQTYLWTSQPPQGVIIDEAYGEYLVWRDAAGRLWVVDVTNMAIAGQVQKPAYESQDLSLIDSIQTTIAEGMHSLAGAGVLVGVAALAYVVWSASR